MQAWVGLRFDQSIDPLGTWCTGSSNRYSHSLRSFPRFLSLVGNEETNETRAAREVRTLSERATIADFEKKAFSGQLSDYWFRVHSLLAGRQRE